MQTNNEKGQKVNIIFILGFDSDIILLKEDVKLHIITMFTQ